MGRMKLNNNDADYKLKVYFSDLNEIQRGSFNEYD